MTHIDNESDFKQTISGLDDSTQRQLAALFTAHVMTLSDDKRIASGVAIAGDPDASVSELSASFKAVKAATFESHTRCGSEGDWTAQAAYFVARSCESALMPEAIKHSSRAIHAATSARMARTARSIDNSDEGDINEREAQYLILNEFLSKRGLT